MATIKLSGDLADWVLRTHGMAIADAVEWAGSLRKLADRLDVTVQALYDARERHGYLLPEQADRVRAMMRETEWE